MGFEVDLTSTSANEVVRGVFDVLRRARLFDEHRWDSLDVVGRNQVVVDALAVLYDVLPKRR